MKVPTMDQLRAAHALAEQGGRAEWEELWRQFTAYGMAYFMVEGASTETFGRGNSPVITGFDPGEVIRAVRIKPLIASCYERWYRRVDWDDTLDLDDFPLTALASAVALYRDGSV